VIEFASHLEDILQVILSIRRVLELGSHGLRVRIVDLLTRDDHHSCELTEQLKHLSITHLILVFPRLPLRHCILQQVVVDQTRKEGLVVFGHVLEDVLTGKVSECKLGQRLLLHGAKSSQGRCVADRLGLGVTCYEWRGSSLQVCF
jgi:hypothetical protein